MEEKKQDAFHFYGAKISKDSNYVIVTLVRTTTSGTKEFLNAITRAENCVIDENSVSVNIQLFESEKLPF